MSRATIKAPLAAQVNAAVTTSQIFPLSSTPTLACTMAVPGSGVLEMKKFIIRATGKATSAGATTTGLATIYGAVALPSAPFTPGNWTVLCSGTARVINTTTCPWFIEAHVAFDLTSGKLQGSFQAMTNALFDTFATLSNPLASIVAAEPLFYLGVGFTFGVNASASNIAVLNEFAIDG